MELLVAINDFEMDYSTSYFSDNLKRRKGGGEELADMPVRCGWTAVHNGLSKGFIDQMWARSTCPNPEETLGRKRRKISTVARAGTEADQHVEAQG